MIQYKGIPAIEIIQYCPLNGSQFGTFDSAIPVVSLQFFYLCVFHLRWWQRPANSFISVIMS